MFLKYALSGEKEGKGNTRSLLFSGGLCGLKAL
jgi:hypothetical protein